MKKQEQLDRLKKKMAKDDLPLKKGSTNLVFGEGSCDAEILFIGEGPGYWEDQKGLPFVGNAGALLNQALYSIEVPREDVYITNIIHYRPPQNRDPNPEEIEAFQPYLDKIIKIIKPRVIVTLGRYSMNKFLPGVFISSIHGKPQVVNWNGLSITIMPMYHPAAGLRNGMIKTKFMEDFKKTPEVLEELKNKKSEAENKSDPTEQMELV